MSSTVNFSAFSIRKPVPAILLFAVLCILGVMSFRTLPVTRFPNIDVPVVAVTITQSGAAPAELETQVTKIVEDSVANITGVKHIVSTLTDGQSTTGIEFRLEINTDRAVNDVKDAIEKARPNLPRTIDEPVIQRIDVEGQAILAYAAKSQGMTLEALSWHVDDTIKRALQGLKGVGRVERYGGVDREIRILLDPDRLLALGITAADVSRQVRATNVDIGSGRGEVGGQEQAIRILAGARKVEDLAETKIVHQDHYDVWRASRREAARWPLGDGLAERATDHTAERRLRRRQILARRHQVATFSATTIGCCGFSRGRMRERSVPCTCQRSSLPTNSSRNTRCSGSCQRLRTSVGSVSRSYSSPCSCPR